MLFARDAATSPTIPIGNDHQFYCAVTCCNSNNCKPSTILKSVRNPYYCPYRQYGANGSNASNGIPNGHSQLSNTIITNNGTNNTCAPVIAYPPNIIAAPIEQFYASGHGYFRRSVPTMPLYMSLLLCILNLLLPGSGTFIASITILFGCNTEYGSNHWIKAFIICVSASILQFITAIFVFGWVWSIMWGIVFIKNSLRYGSKRDIYTVSLC